MHCLMEIHMPMRYFTESVTKGSHFAGELASPLQAAYVMVLSKHRKASLLVEKV